MKQVHPNYTFDATTKTITLTGLNIAQDQLLLITNATRGIIYYNFASSSLKANVTPGTNTTVVLTDASTTGHSNSDQLLIHYEDQLSTQTVAGTVTANGGDFAKAPQGETSPEKAIRLGFADDESWRAVGLASGGSPLPTQLFDGGGEPVGTAWIGGSAHLKVAVGNSVTVGSLPAISGTVTANPAQYSTTLVTSFSFSSAGNSNPFSLSVGQDEVFEISGNFTASTDCVYRLDYGQASPSGWTVTIGTQAVYRVNPYQEITTFGGSTGSKLFVRNPVGPFFRFVKVSGTTGTTINVTISRVNIPNYGVPVQVSGPLTDTQLRATAVPVSGTVTATLNLSNLVDGQAIGIPLQYNNTGDGDGATVVNIYKSPGSDTGGLPIQNTKNSADESIIPLAVTLANTGANSTAILTTDRGATGMATVLTFTSTTSSELRAANSSRKMLTVFNEGAGNLHILYGDGTASTTNYSARLSTGDYLEIEKYTGRVMAIFASAGTARVTEIT